MLDKETHWNPIRASAGRRVVAAESHWNLPAKWNAAAEREGVRRRVFCGAMADVFEDWRNLVRDTNGRPLHHAQAWGHSGHWVGINGVFIGQSIVTLDDVRRRVFATIDATPWLDWIVPTQWPQNERRMWPEVYSKGSYTPAYVVGGEIVGPDYTPEYHRPNVWLLANVRDQNTADAMIPALLECRDLVPVLGVSCELVGPVNLTPWIERLDWVRVGGEVGPKAKPCDITWIRSIVDQCLLAGVPCFVPQLGSMPMMRADSYEGRLAGDNPESEWPIGTMFSGLCRHIGSEWQGRSVRLRDKSGSDPAEWPEDLRVREYPEVLQ